MLTCPVCRDLLAPIGPTTVERVATATQVGARVTDALGHLHTCGRIDTAQAAAPRRWVIDRDDHGSVLSLHGEFDTSFDGLAAHRLCESALAASGRLRLDARELTFFDVATLRLLLRIAHGRDGMLPVIEPSPFLERVAALVGATDVFTTLHDAPSRRRRTDGYGGDADHQRCDRAGLN